MSAKVRVGISIGDINGIAPEVIIKSLMDDRIFKLLTVVIYGSSKALSYHKQVLKIEQFKFEIIRDFNKLNQKIANLVNCWDQHAPVQLGVANQNAGELALKSLDTALKDLADGKIDFLVTAPLNKNMIKIRDYEFKGHTEYITEYLGGTESLMMMVNENLRVGLVTGHTALKEVAEKITPELLEKKIRLLHHSLKTDFLINKPKIAVLGLNPHAGEEGLLGKEEKEILIPTLQKLKKQDFMLMGPYPADGFFGQTGFLNFDAVLAMYHDQGLIPFKSIAFHNGVNFTAGLKWVRTSPDHGTAYDIAGKNKAAPDSFRNALFTGMDIFRNRKSYQDMTKNPLVKTHIDSESA